MPRLRCRPHREQSWAGGRFVSCDSTVLVVTRALTVSKIWSLAERRKRRTRKTAISESGHQIDAVRAVLLHLAAADWIGTMAGIGTTGAEETTIVLAVPRHHVVTMYMDAAHAIVATAARTTVTLTLVPDLDHLGMAGTGMIPTDVGVPVHADVVLPNLIWTSRNDTANRYPTCSCSSSRRYSETLSVGSRGPSTSVD